MGNSCTKQKSEIDDDDRLRRIKEAEFQSLETSSRTDTTAVSSAVPSPLLPPPSFRQDAHRGGLSASTATATATETATDTSTKTANGAMVAATDALGMTNGASRDRSGGPSSSSFSDQTAARLLVAAHDEFIRARDPSKALATDGALSLPAVAGEGEAAASSYMRAREELARREAVLAFDYPAVSSATPLERQVSAIVAAVRARDDTEVFAAAPPRSGHGGQKLPRFAGDHFLSNGDLIAETGLFRIAQRMPKGAHLHIHFNACLLPRVLLGLAATMERMYVTSDVALGPDTWDSCMLEFSILPPGKEAERPGNLFGPDYVSRNTMRFGEFLKVLPVDQVGCSSAMEWLEGKATFGEDETHSVCQTSLGAWEKFNGRTRMMKGLFNYETAFRTYISLLLDDFARDNIQYAEIRPNFMKTNQLWTDDGTRTIDNLGIMEIITSSTSAYLAANPRSRSRFRGLKVIYCTPRVFGADLVAHALDECIAFAQRWPGWIAGFDLVGEESAGHPLRHFAPQLLAFRARCDALGLHVPFLFHCGETTDAGSGADGNVLDALLLGAARVGHGFALPRHPYVVEHMKARGVCVELCPISNEILGLTPRVGGHAMYAMLANNVHCTVSSDNGTLFKSSLSHDFYQVMVGKRDMTLFGWKQLILWSLEHSCLTTAERADITQQWQSEWDDFLSWVVDEYGALVA